jgi:hypothetical protein
LMLQRGKCGQRGGGREGEARRLGPSWWCAAEAFTVFSIIKRGGRIRRRRRKGMRMRMRMRMRKIWTERRNAVRMRSTVWMRVWYVGWYGGGGIIAWRIIKREMISQIHTVQIWLH